MHASPSSRFVLAVAGAFFALGLTAPAGRAEVGTLATIRQRDLLLVGNKQVFPTFNIKDSATGRNEGFFADLARALAKHLLGDENKVEFLLTTDENRFARLADGEVDVLIDTIPTSEEKERLADLTTETFRSGSGLLVKKGGPIRGLADIKAGTRVAYVKANEDIALLKAQIPDAIYLEHETSAEALKTLKAGRADVFTQVVTHLFRAASQDANYVVVGRFTTKPYHIFLRKGDPEFQASLNGFLKSLRDSGEYDRLFAKWFGPYGGDSVR
jgi:aspartate/glutamate/glutamine transport system substrate-binding protein